MACAGCAKKSRQGRQAMLQRQAANSRVVGQPTPAQKYIAEMKQRKSKS